ncbi:uncharacterized protein LOC122000519 [Zingiber officinale]|uniref:6,7-dimethyl-8-ribityllumazine synthase n=1 Tax=Zingiber officinale TaxID=94328 RepID=A0A8J5KY94_ZINOF|nr:uncharacterized protein LOC122000519 [Zingiber officinale]KAG6494119.1 hypothetical protein ZIOFF_049138 [Zingiber officinale]
MGNSLRCCLACVLPCGALDVVRIVHLDGNVEEYSRPVHAGKILSANPHHVLTTPCSPGVASRKILIVSPETELKRGRLYFLIPGTSLPTPGEKKKRKVSRRKQKLEKEAEGETHLESKAACHLRRRNGRVGLWRPNLESISED